MTGYILPGLVLIGVLYATGIVVTALAVVGFRLVAWYVGEDMSDIDPWWKIAGPAIVWPWLVRDAVQILRQLHTEDSP